MNEVFIICLFLSGILLGIIGMNLFEKRWKNMFFYLIVGGVLTYLTGKFSPRFFVVDEKLMLLVIVPYVIFFLVGYFLYGLSKTKSKPREGEDVFKLESEDRTIEFYYPRDNFMVLGGAGSGKTASVGKPIMEEFIKNNWAGFIYDYKDYDYTKTAWNLVKKHNYKYEFYYISFTDMSRTYRFNILDKKVITRVETLFQAMDDFLKSMQPADGKTDEWYNGALGLLKGVAVRFFSFQGEYAKFCTLPHILNFILLASPEELSTFIKGDMMAKRVAGAFVGSERSERTLSSIIFSLNNYISNLATNKNICYVLSGDDFIFNLTDPECPKLFAVSNNFALESLISPIVAMLVPLSARRIEFGNKIKFAFILDEMTTFKVNNFQGMPSVLREYNTAFLVLTQSGNKFEKLYGKDDRASILANFANLFLGRTKDVEALKYYPLFFGKEEKEKKSYSAGSSGNGHNNSSVTTSKQKEEIYDSNAFAELRQGEFIMSAGESNVKRIKTRFKKFELKEEPLPVVRLTLEKEIEDNYLQITLDCERLLQECCGRDI